MKVPRVSLAWIAVLVVLSILVFFTYHIFVAKSNSDSEPKAFGVLPNEAHPRRPSSHAPVRVLEERVPLPAVPAQTEEDLRADEPLRATPPDAHYEEPESTDPLEAPVHSMSEFGDNLRHPEQMIEMAPPLGTSRMVPAELGSEATSAGRHRPAEYAPEMVQNGGEFADIVAYEGGDAGIAYSML